MAKIIRVSVAPRRSVWIDKIQHGPGAIVALEITEARRLADAGFVVISDGGLAPMATATPVQPTVTREGDTDASGPKIERTEEPRATDSKTVAKPDAA